MFKKVLRTSLIIGLISTCGVAAQEVELARQKYYNERLRSKWEDEVQIDHSWFRYTSRPRIGFKKEKEVYVPWDCRLVLPPARPTPGAAYQHIRSETTFATPDGHRRKCGSYFERQATSSRQTEIWDWKSERWVNLKLWNEGKDREFLYPERVTLVLGSRTYHDLSAEICENLFESSARLTRYQEQSKAALASPKFTHRERLCVPDRSAKTTHEQVKLLSPRTNYPLSHAYSKSVIPTESPQLSSRPKQAASVSTAAVVQAVTGHAAQESDAALSQEVMMNLEELKRMKAFHDHFYSAAITDTYKHLLAATVSKAADKFREVPANTTKSAWGKRPASPIQAWESNRLNCSENYVTTSAWCHTAMSNPYYSRTLERFGLVPPTLQWMDVYLKPNQWLPTIFKTSAAPPISTFDSALGSKPAQILYEYVDGKKRQHEQWWSEQERLCAERLKQSQELYAERLKQSQEAAIKLKTDDAKRAILALHTSKTGSIGAEDKSKIGDAYYAGNGVQKDVHEARMWYEKAAAGGNSASMFKLGLIYYNSEGGTYEEGPIHVRRSIALKWFRRALDKTPTPQPGQWQQQRYCAVTVDPQYQGPSTFMKPPSETDPRLWIDRILYEAKDGGYLHQIQ